MCGQRKASGLVRLPVWVPPPCSASLRTSPGPSRNLAAPPAVLGAAKPAPYPMQGPGGVLLDALGRARPLAQPRADEMHTSHLGRSLRLLCQTAAGLCVHSCSPCLLSRLRARARPPFPTSLAADRAGAGQCCAGCSLLWCTAYCFTDSYVVHSSQDSATLQRTVRKPVPEAHTASYKSSPLMVVHIASATY